jgi:hypothetical protein
MAALVGAFEMELEDRDWKLDIQGGITARPKGGLRVRVFWQCREVHGVWVFSLGSVTC